jgi:DNA modification methylase
MKQGAMGIPDDGKRNRRSVWTVATRPYKGAHFATFPPALIEPCILAGSRPGDIVLDPFMGSGTTAAAALQHGRQYLGCELNPEYKALQDERVASITGYLDL